MAVPNLLGSNCLQQPARAIADNAGADGAVVVHRIRSAKPKNEGYDADKHVYGDMVAAGIIADFR